MSGLEVYNISGQTMNQINKLITEYDRHERREAMREVATCRSCRFYLTCLHSPYSNSARERKAYDARDNDSKAFYAGSINPV